jgi:hypothetical protein
MNLNDQFFAAKTTAKGAIDGPETDTAGVGNGLGAVARGDRDSHDFKVHTFCEESKPKLHTFGQIAQNAKKPHRIPVSRARIPRDDSYWPQRLFVMGKIDAEIASGVPIEELPRTLG